jgi:hypothetical protein
LSIRRSDGSRHSENEAKPLSSLDGGFVFVILFAFSLMTCQKMATKKEKQNQAQNKIVGAFYHVGKAVTLGVRQILFTPHLIFSGWYWFVQNQL